MKDIHIAIATIESRLNNAISLANKFSSFDVAVSVYCQGNKVGQDHIDGTNIIYLNSIGVTKSRNYAIDDCCLPYIWFMDDDVDIVENEVVKTIQDIKSTTSTIMLTRVVNENLKLRKKYPSSSCVKTRDLLRVGTIEIIANVSFLKKNNIRFPEDMGAGSDFPVGDEAVFLKKCLNKNAKFINLITSPIIHPDESSGRLSGEKHIVSKGLMLKRVYGIKSLFVCIYLAYKIKNKTRGYFRTLIMLLKGYSLT